MEGGGNGFSHRGQPSSGVIKPPGKLIDRLSICYLLAVKKEENLKKNEKNLFLLSSER